MKEVRLALLGMRKIMLKTMIVLGFFSVASNATAQVMMIDNVKEEVVDKFYPIDVSEIPQVLLDAINTNYEGFLVKSVDVSNNNTIVKYKVVVVSRNGKMSKVYFDDRGNILKEHAYFQ